LWIAAEEDLDKSKHVLRNLLNNYHVEYCIIRIKCVRLKTA